MEQLPTVWINILLFCFHLLQWRATFIRIFTIFLLIEFCVRIRMPIIIEHTKCTFDIDFGAKWTGYWKCFKIYWIQFRRGNNIYQHGDDNTVTNASAHSVKFFWIFDSPSAFKIWVNKTHPTTMAYYYWNFNGSDSIPCNGFSLKVHKSIIMFAYRVKLYKRRNRTTPRAYKWKDPFTVHFNVCNVTFLFFFFFWVFCVLFVGILPRAAANRDTLENFIIYALSTRMNNDKFSWKETKPYRVSARRVGCFFFFLGEKISISIKWRWTALTDPIQTVKQWKILTKNHNKNLFCFLAIFIVNCEYIKTIQCWCDLLMLMLFSA